MFSNWGKKSKTQKPSHPPRAAPPAHQHAHARPNSQAQAVRSQRAATVSSQKPAHVMIKPASASQRATAARPASTVSSQASKASTISANDDADDDDDDDMFGGMDIADDAGEEEETEATEQPSSQRAYSVEELSKMSEAEQFTYALQISMHSKDPKSEQQTSETTPKQGNIHTPSTSSVHSSSRKPPQPQPGQSHPPPAYDLTSHNHIHNHHKALPTSSNTTSAFGFDLSNAAAVTENASESEQPGAILDHFDNNINAAAAAGPSSLTSAFGFDLSNSQMHEQQQQQQPKVASSSAAGPDDDYEEAADNMFGGMDVEAEPNHHNHVGLVTPSQSSTTTTTTAAHHQQQQLSESPFPVAAAVIDDVDDSVLSQLKHAEQQHERTRKRVWTQIKQCIERGQRIKDRENELLQKLQQEQARKCDAEETKKMALQQANFEDAEKAKNSIRRAMKSIQDCQHALSKCNADVKQIHADQSRHEETYMKESKVYQAKLDGLVGAHERVTTASIEEELKRIEKEEKKFKEKLERTEREIQLDRERIEKCKERVQEIEDRITSDVEPYQQALDGKNRDKTALELEIDELNKQLVLKRDELSTVESEIDGLNQEVATVRKRYKSQMDEILDEQGRYEQSTEQFTLQKNEYVMTLNALNNDMLSNKDKERAFEQELCNLQTRIANINVAFERFESKQTRQQEWFVEEQRLLDAQVQLNKQADDFKYAVEKLEKEIKQIDAKCVQHRQTVQTVDNALPILHADKQTAVHNENYLDAGKIHKQIQQKTAQRDKAMQQLNEYKEKSEQLKRKLHDEQSQEVRIKQELDDIQSKIHQQRFELVMDHRVSIKHSLAALEGDDDAEHGRDVEHVVLELELKQIESELQFFHQTYGWNVDYKEPSKAVNEQQSFHVDKLPLDGDGDDDDDDGDGSKLLMSPNTALTAESSIVTPLMSPSVGKPKTKQEISAQIDRIQSDIVENEQEMQTLQTAINEAVANEDYESAGQMAPKKKRLTAQGKALKDKLQRREQEFADAVDEDEDEDEEEKEPETQEEEEQVEEATVVHDNAHAQEQEQKTEDSDAVHVNTINADAESNTGYNGGGAITIDSNGDNSEQASNEEMPETIAQEIDVVQQLETDMIPKNVAETNSGSVSDQISNDEVEQNGINIADKHQDDDDDDNNDMFGDMDMDVAEEDTVNID